MIRIYYTRWTHTTATVWLVYTKPELLNSYRHDIGRRVHSPATRALNSRHLMYIDPNDPFTLEFKWEDL